MPRYCCSCSGTGTCSNCSCCKAGRKCVRCVPALHRRCKNQEIPALEDDAENVQGGVQSSCPARITTSPAFPRRDPVDLPGQPGPVPADDAIDNLLQAARDTAAPRVDVPNDATLAENIARIYNESVTWRANLFEVPLGATGKAFINELAHIIQGFADQADVAATAWMRVSVACQLLLQKPQGSPKPHNLSEVLQNRLQLWEENQYNELFDEAVSIQQHLQVSYGRNRSYNGAGTNDTTFSNLVFHGKLPAASRSLSTDQGGGPLKLDSTVNGTDRTVLDVLKEKHPRAVTPPNDALLQQEDGPFRRSVFDGITAKRIQSVARSIHGSAGPSGVDADSWKRMLTFFGKASDRLCAAMAAATKYIATTAVDGEALEAFTAARLIPLDKCPGVRPIAVGEVHRRIIGKTIMDAIESDVRSVTAPLQLCVGIPFACETAVHAMATCYDATECEAVLFVDASNAFNSLNRSAALHNIDKLCPALGRVFRNTYRRPIRLFVTGGAEIESVEGTCQGDPLAMAVYATATMPLISRLADRNPDVTQSWFADDDATAGKVLQLRQYWDDIESEGPKFGYFPNASKTVLLVKPEHLTRAQEAFANCGIAIRTDGCKYLGGAVGSAQYCQQVVKEHVDDWSVELSRCAEFATTQPHAAYTVLTKSLVPKWQYLPRAMPACSVELDRLDRLVDQSILPALTGHNINGDLRRLTSLPARDGGLCIPIVGQGADAAYEQTTRIIQPMVQLILASQQQQAEDQQQQAEDQQQPPAPAATRNPLVEALGQVNQTARQHRVQKREGAKLVIEDITPTLTSTQKTLTSIAHEKGVSSWLTVAPLYSFNTVLNKSDFRDAVCLRYGLVPDGVPPSCVCGEDMSLDHALTCPTGGYPTARHDELRDVIASAIGDLLPDVQVEPKLLPYDGEHLDGRGPTRDIEARADIRARGFWTRQQDAFFDVTVTHPKANLQSRPEVLQQLKKAEDRKKGVYSQRIATIDRGSFTPLAFSTNGICGKECTAFMKALAASLCRKKSDLQYSKVIFLLRCKVRFSLLRWSITCIRGCRASYGRHRGRASFANQCRLLN